MWSVMRSSAVPSNAGFVLKSSGTIVFESEQGVSLSDSAGVLPLSYPYSRIWRI